jgi:crossover junction endodeoxyribonuclease RusA
MTLSGYKIQQAQTTQALRDAVMTQGVSLSWPPKELKPNSRVHWAAKANAVKRYKRDCLWNCTAAKIKPFVADSVTLSIVFHPPTNRHFDLDNALASIKPGIDAIAFWIEIDDRHFSYQISRGAPVKHGRVDVTIGVA